MIPVAALVLMLAQAALVSPAAAACTFPVDVATEAELNAAISCYNGTTAAGAYTITLTQNINLTASTTAIDNATSGVSLTIEGGGFAVDGQYNVGVRPFDIAASTSVTMRQLAVTRGLFTASDPGAVGGGIRNSGALTIIDSTISNNQTHLFGGGIGNESGGNLTIRNSTISGNSNNAAGGGILNKGQLTLDSVTMTGNQTGNSGALQVDGSGAVAIIQNSILANTSTSGGPGRDCETVNGGTVTDGGHNLVEVQKDCGFVNGANGNILGVDPVLGRLANNGGPTQTAALLPGSPAIDAGSTTLTAD